MLTNFKTERYEFSNDDYSEVYFGGFATRCSDEDDTSNFTFIDAGVEHYTGSRPRQGRPRDRWDVLLSRRHCRPPQQLVSSRCSFFANICSYAFVRYTKLAIRQRFGRSFVSDRCLSVCPVCDVVVSWPNGCKDQDATWYGGRPRPRPHCLTWGPSSP